MVFRYRLAPTPGYEYVSPSVLQLAGYTPDEVYAGPELGFVLVHPDDRLLFDDTLAGRRAAPDPFVLRWQRKDGTTVWVELRSTPFVRPDGSIGFDGVARDVTAQKAAEDGLRAAQQEAAQLARIMASADEAFIGETLDGIVTRWNAAAERLFGYTAGEMLGQSVLRLAPPGDEAAQRRIVERLAAGEHVDPYEAVRRAKDGTLVEVSISASAVRDARGELTGIAVFAHDIGPRKRSEAALAASEARFRAVAEHIPTGLAVVNAAMTPTYVNPAFTALFGYTLDDVASLAAWFARAYPDPAYRATIAADWSGAADAVLQDSVSPPRAREHRITCADGTVRAALVTAKAVGDTVYVAFTDVTDQRVAAAERDRLVAAVEQAPDAIGIADADGTLIYANAALGELAGRPIGELLGGPAVAMMGRGVEARMDALWERLRVGHAVTRAFAAERPDGSTFRAEGTIAPLRDADGVITHFTFVARDVTHVREVEEDLALEASMHAVLAEALLEARLSDSLEEAIQRICDGLGRLPEIDYAGVEVFEGDERVVVLASHVPAGFALERGVQIPPTHAAYVRERVATGPWAEYWEALPEDGVFDTLMRDIGLKAMAIAPITHGDHVDGLLAIGTRRDDFAKILVERRHTLVASSTTSSALLAERLHARRYEVELRRMLGEVIASRLFHPVFQPIVDLASGEVVGYEALTRFESGQRPDLCFADAWSVGLGPELELATLEAAVTDAPGLPAGRWLDLNVSARLLDDGQRLREILWSADRPIVIEITEHEVIADYRHVREAASSLGHDVRVAVDDAGAGAANLGHIIELQPDFVKLDISLVRRVNANLGRQAMVAGMRHFARTAGCRLVAEGIETQEEARTLTELGVELGQGYLYGYPDRAEAWASAKPAD